MFPEGELGRTDLWPQGEMMGIEDSEGGDLM